MKNLVWLYLIVIFFTFANIARGQSATKSEAILMVPSAGNSAVVEVTLGQDDIPQSMPIGSLFSIEKNVEREISEIPNNIAPPFTKFTINFPAYNPIAKATYEVVLLFNAKDASGNIFKRRLTLPVKGVVEAEVLRVYPACTAVNNIQVIFTTPVLNGFNWQPTINWLDSYINNRTVFADVTIKQKGKKEEIYKVVSLTRDSQGAVGNQLATCLVLDRSLPSGTFDATVDFSKNPPPPADLRANVSAKKLEGTFAMKFPKDEKQESPEKRKLENTIDFGVSFTSSVRDEEVPANGSTPATNMRKRRNIGVFDLGFEYPEILKPIYESNRWMTFFTPLFVKASVSTTKIDKDTLSQNRILFGFKGESRYRQRVGKEFASIHRIEWGLTHASDRDFKQKEIYASLTYKPLFDALFKPYALNYKIGLEGEPVSKGYGFTIVPMVGFDFGRTYSRRNPAAAIKSSPTIKRLYYGLKLGLDITQYISLTAENTLYVRFENPDDRLKNLFKAQGEFKLFRSSNNRLAHSLFVTYEKGQSPPFATPDANSLRVGYRVIGNFCGIYCR